MKNSIEEEVWKAVPQTNGMYEVSNFGQIRSWKRGGKRGKYPKILNTIDKDSYKSLTTRLIDAEHVSTFRVHRIVATLFIDNPNNYPCVLHIDNNKKNAHYKNLKWGTHKQNMQDAFRDGLIKLKGVQRNRSNLTENDVVDIFNSKETCRALAKKYSVNYTCIVDIRSGRSWNHITGLLCTRKIKPKFSKDIKFVDD